ncbi:MAG: rhomboid family intramembrane serine protease [Candidatus Kapabacteria bacterium]|nr:rhomboid family intramembrane serine protease [Candidatus Kapabacteria bacterium]
MQQNYRVGNFGGFSMFPPVIKFLLVSNVIVFFFQEVFLGILGEFFHVGNLPLEYFYMKFLALQPVAPSGHEFSSNFYFWQLLTYQFMHGSFWHLFFNMLALWMFGAELETLWGSRKFIIYYLLCGIGAGLTQLYISPIFSFPAPTIGASGAIYGILAAFGMNFPNRKIMMFPIFIPIPAKIFVIIFGAMELINGLGSSDGVAHFAHLGGAAIGVLLVLFGDKWGIYSFFDKIFSAKKEQKIGGSSFGNFGSGQYTGQQQQSQPKVIKTNWFKKADDPLPVPRPSQTFTNNGEEIDQRRIDEILDKISARGYQSLNDREKDILNELSKKLK